MNLLSRCETEKGNDESGKNDVLIADLIEWLHANGAYINEKVAVKHSDANDKASPLGLIAISDMNEGEKICHIPPHLILQPRKGDCKDSDCGTIRATYEMLSEKEPNPWARYLLSLTPKYTPEFWSDQGRSMLKKMTNDVLPPGYIDETLEELDTYCHGDVNDPIYIHAAMLVKSRADYNYLVPFYGMTNHHNGKLNMRHVFNPYKVNVNKTGYAIETTRAVSSGEQLYNSYNQCNICDEYCDWYGTPELFLSFGFVEQYPQRWLFDLSRIKFDLDVDPTKEGKVSVTFLVPPSKKGINMLRNELKRLDEFSKKHRSENDVGMPKNEWQALWEYYDALHNALSCAVECDVPLTDEVWEMPHNWWVKNGTLRESDLSEHFVRRSA